MAILKHVGRMINNKRKIVVAFRVVPGEPENCIVITTENLSADEHDTLMKMVESPAGQEATELSQVMARTSLPDGRNMLAHFHASGKMVKVPTNLVEMVPNRNTTIKLSELNELIAQQMGVTVEDLAVPGGNKKPTKEQPVETVTEESKENAVLTDEDLAKQYRSQADALYKEAKRLRDMAEELSPSKKIVKKKAEESA